MNNSWFRAFKWADPRIVIKPSKATKLKQAKHLNLKLTGGAFPEGYYINTTRFEVRDTHFQHYLYMWKYTCHW